MTFESSSTNSGLNMDFSELNNCINEFFEVEDYMMSEFTNFPLFKACINTIEDERLKLYAQTIEFKHLAALSNLLKACSAKEYSETDIRKIVESKYFLVSFKDFIPSSGPRKNVNFIEFILQRLDSDGDDEIKAANLEVLLKLGFDPNSRGPESLKSPLEFACAKNMKSCVEILLKYGADVNTFDVFGSTSLSSACFTGNWKIINLLLRHDAKIFTESHFKAFISENSSLDAAATEEYVQNLKNDNFLVGFHPQDYAPIRNIITLSDIKVQQEIVKDLPFNKQVEIAYEFGLIDALQNLLQNCHQPAESKFKYLNRFTSREAIYRSQYQSTLLAVSILDMNIHMIKALKLKRQHEGDFKSFLNANFISEKFVDKLENYNSGCNLVFRKHRFGVDSLPIKLASWIGDYEILKYLIDNGVSTLDFYTIMLAVRSGNFNMIKLIHEISHLPWPNEIFEEAIGTRNVEIILFLMANRNFTWTEETQQLAISRGLDSLLHTFNPEFFTSKDAEVCASLGKIGMLKHLLDLGIILSENPDKFSIIKERDFPSIVSIRSMIETDSCSRISYFHYRNSAIELTILLLDGLAVHLDDLEVLNYFTPAKDIVFKLFTFRRLSDTFAFEGFVERIVNESVKKRYNALVRVLFDLIKLELDHLYDNCAEKTMLSAAVYGNNEIIDFLLSLNVPVDRLIFYYASINGHLDILKRFKSFHGISSYDFNLNPSEVIKRGHLDVYKHLVECSKTVGSVNQDLGIAILNRQHHLVDFLLERNSDNILEKCLFSAVKVGDFKIIEKAFNSSASSACLIDLIESQEILNEAVNYGDSQIIVFLLKLQINPELQKTLKCGGCNFGQFLIETSTCSQLIADCCKKGLQDVIEFWIAINGKFDENSFLNATIGGFVAIVKLLFEFNPSLCTSNAFDAAVLNGHLEIVKFFIEKQGNCTDKAFIDAIDRGHYHIIDVLLSYGSIQITTASCIQRAIEKFHFDVATVLLKNSPLLSESQIGTLPEFILIRAFTSGHFELIEQLLDKLPSTFPALLATGAASNGHYNVVNLLIKHGKVCPEFFRKASSGGFVEILKLLFDNHIECPDDVINIAASKGHYDSVALLLSFGINCSAEVLDSAAKVGAFSIVQLLLLHGKPFTNTALIKALSENYSEIVDLLHKYKHLQILEKH